LQRQINFVDNVIVQIGTHRLKLGMDFRRLSPLAEAPGYLQEASFSDVSSAQNGSPSFIFIVAQKSPTLLFRNLGLFVQDTWRVAPGLTVTYGLRWDVDIAPASLRG